MTDEITLLPCPFCGGEADEYEGEYGNGIYCMMCGAKMGDPIHLEYRLMNRVSIDKAIAAWNTRAELGSGNADTDYALALLDEIREAGRIYYDDYSDLFDAIAELGNGTCGLEPLSALDVTLNMLDSIEWGACSECGCAVPMDAKFCNECGKRVKS